VIFETFYCFQEIRDKYKDNVFKIFHILKSKINNLEKISIYGELFGGIYPHPEEKDLGYQPIQRGVYYCPNIEFYAFDIELHTPARSWMNYEEVIVILKQHEFFYAKPLLTGTLSECFAFDIKQNSTIPELLGLKPIKQNQMEGVVIKTVEPVIIPGKGSRAIFKHKNAKFEEVNPPAPETMYEKKSYCYETSCRCCI